MNDPWSFLEGLNMSELTEMAAANNMNAHRGLPRDVLVALVKGTHIDLPTRHIDIWRKTIFAFVDNHWKQCSPLLSCPMKTRSPTACFRCPDIQVAECTLQNHDTLILVRDMHRKKERQT